MSNTPPADPTPPNPAQPSAPASAQPAAPSYAPPVAPSYGQPVAPGYPQQGAYAQPAYGAAPGYGYPPAQKTNVMAILSLVFAFVFSILGIVFGHIALSQIKKTGESGHGLAVAGLVIGYVFVGLGVLFAIFYVIVIVAAIGSAATYGSFSS